MKSDPQSTRDDLTLTLTRSEALVLFEWLATKAETAPIDDDAERVVLWKMEAQLEKVLVEPLRADYTALLAEARRSVRASAMDGPDTFVDGE